MSEQIRNEEECFEALMEVVQFQQEQGTNLDGFISAVRRVWALASQSSELARCEQDLRNRGYSEAEIERIMTAEVTKRLK